MNDSAAILAYANPLGDQPAGSAFTVTTFEDGVELTKPLPRDRLRVLVFGLVGGATLAVVIGVGIAAATKRPRDRDPLSVLLPVMVLLTAIAGHMLWYVGSISRSRVLTITLRRGRLTVRHAVWTITGSTWVVAHPRRFTTSICGFDIVGRCVLGTVIVHGQLRLGRAFLHSLPRDECIWITRLLNNALASGPLPVEALRE